MTRTGEFAYLSCKDITRKLMTQKSVLQTDDNIAHKIEYPHNVLRNIAKEGALTEYILGMDFWKKNKFQKNILNENL